MNYTLPPGDCGHRSRDTRWQSGPARALPGALGLVAGITTAACSATVGHGCATFGPRSPGGRRLEVSDHCWRQTRKSPPQQAWRAMRLHVYLRSPMLGIIDFKVKPRFLCTASEHRSRAGAPESG